ncbi:hypothetical protein QM012_004295 [Aureobasidium pullulans]|uniref:Uncharacterized protein n=1 Tax=Aureobasidium pullulans TaxID=5580 RepID=A0ABR0TTJ7_AURPU
MGLPVWRDPEETRSSSGSPAAISRVKNDSTATSRSPIRRLRPSRPTSFHRVGQPPHVPEAPRRVLSSGRHFDLAYYLDDDNPPSQQHTYSSRRRSQPSSFLPPPLERDRPQSRNGASSSLPSPPLDTSEPVATSRIVLLRTSQSPHPLSFAHRPVSPEDGLGDRNRSPSPIPDAWHVIGSTITPDDSLPSADSSFASNGVSTSFSRTDALADALAEDSSSTVNESQSHDRRAVEALLYDFAMQTAEGRAQIQLLRRMSPEDVRWMRHHSSASQEDGDNEDDNGNNDADEAPPPRPSQFDSDIRERSRQVASSTMRYFGNAYDGASDGQQIGRLRRVETPPLSRSASPSGARLLPNTAARRSLMRILLSDAEQHTPNESLE